MLTISGTGEMDEFELDELYAPWDSYSRSINTVMIENGVTSIGDYAFCDCESLTSVTIPDSVTSISKRAFAGCNNLQSVFFDGTLSDRADMEIGSDNEELLDAVWYYLTDVTDSGDCGSNGRWMLYADAGLLRITGMGAMQDYYSLDDIPWYSYHETIQTVVIVNGVTRVGNSAFSGCASLTSVSIPDSVTSIGNSAFYGCASLTSVSIPDSVTSIGSSAFYGCTGLTAIDVDANNTAYCSDENGVLFNKDKTKLIQYPAGNAGNSYTVPNSVYIISDSAFRGCANLAHVTIPGSAASISTARPIKS